MNALRPTDQAHPLLQATRVDLPIEEYLRSVGKVFVRIDGHDSGNTSYGVAVGPERWFVKHSEHADGIRYLENAIRDRQWGLERFMAPEEFECEALIEERTTAFNLGRAAFVVLGASPRGGTDRNYWRGSQALYDVAMKATATDQGQRSESMAAFAVAWHAAGDDPTGPAI